MGQRKLLQMASKCCETHSCWSAYNARTSVLQRSFSRRWLCRLSSLLVLDATYKPRNFLTINTQVCKISSTVLCDSCRRDFIHVMKINLHLTIRAKLRQQASASGASQVPSSSAAGHAAMSPSPSSQQGRGGRIVTSGTRTMQG